jgi:hypothetical protein
MLFLLHASVSCLNTLDNTIRSQHSDIWIWLRIRTLMFETLDRVFEMKARRAFRGQAATWNTEQAQKAVSAGLSGHGDHRHGDHLSRN